MNKNKLYDLRKNNNITQSKLANILGIANNTLSQYENNQRQMPDEIKIKIADFFNVSVDYLLGRENEPIAIPPELENTRFAFHKGLDGLSQEDIDDVAKYIDYLKSKKK